MKSILESLASGMNALVNTFASDIKEEQDMKPAVQESEAARQPLPENAPKFSQAVLDDLRKNAGRYPAETGGMLGSTENENLIDLCHFDTHSKNSPGTFYYDVESMSEVFRQWKHKGYITNGIYHSHPAGCIRPSYHDISSALLHLRFFKLDYFYLPILQSSRKGLYTLYFYVVREKGSRLEAVLEYVLKAEKEGYASIPFEAWKESYSIDGLEAYRQTVDDENRQTQKRRQPEVKKEDRVVKDRKEPAMKYAKAHSDTSAYFSKVKSLYPPHVLDKVIVSVGTGGARSALTNFARCGFNRFILIEADTVGESNIATQAVHISEMGKKKAEVIKDEILDINPNAQVICVTRFLDDDMSDEEFRQYLNAFPVQKSTDYLILGCTDNFEAQKRSSLLALKYGVPYLAAMMYKGGAAAELIFTYPGVTASCPRCLLGSRFEKYENGFENDVDSSACSIFATERMNALKGMIAIMLLMYQEDPGNPLSTQLDLVKDRNFVQIRLDPFLQDSLGIGTFDRVLTGASRYTFMDETLWIPQKPDHPDNGFDECPICGGTGHLEDLQMKWPDTRKIDTRPASSHPYHSDSCKDAAAAV